MVPCSVNKYSKRDKGEHGVVTINNARIITYNTDVHVILSFAFYVSSVLC